VITIAPDCSPSTVHADEYVPVRPGGDAALALFDVSRRGR